MSKSISGKLIFDQYLIFKSFETSVIGITFALILFFFSLSGIHHLKLGLKDFQKNQEIEQCQFSSPTPT